MAADPSKNQHSNPEPDSTQPLQSGEVRHGSGADEGWVLDFPQSPQGLRRRAEALQASAGQALERQTPASLEETQRLLHELQVHQIELEMQNEELRRAQLELDAEHLRYFDLYDIAPVADCTVSEQGLIQQANLTAAALLGWPRHQLIQQRLTRFIFRDDQDSYYLLHRQVKQSDGPQACELRMLKADHSLFWVHLVLTVSPDEDGAPTCRIVWSDISHRKATENALHETLADFGSVLETTLDGFWRVNMQGQLLDVNQAYCRKSGYARDELIGMNVSDLEAHESVEETAKHLRRVVENGHEQFETRHRRKDGSLWWVEVSATYCKTHGGQLFALFRNVTERRLAAQAMQIAAIAFESQEGMFVTDAKREILQVNRAFTEMTGYTEQEAVGQNPRMLSSGHHDAAFYASLFSSLELSGSWSGEIWNRRKSGEVFPQWVTITAVKDAFGSTTHYVATSTDISSRKAAENEIRNLAFFDPLTGLPNRRLLMDRLEMTMAAGSRTRRKGALIFVDLDNFKTLNDTLGHVSGDILLEQVARRLATCIREGDTVARLGGDEFVVMLKDLSESDLEAATQAETVGEKILVTLSQNYSLGNHAHHSTASVGITLFGGEVVESMDEPLKRADLAMYQAKAAGRNTLRFFDPRMQAMVMARAAWESDLRGALEQDQFALYYQIQDEGEHGALVGVEALVRWNHPQRGLVSPADFIALAEETGLILPLGQWVLETACIQITRWAARPETARLSIAVNVSALQFHQDGFVEQVVATLQRTGANSRRLKLELTESLLVSNVEATIEKMNALKAVGVGFSLDDFGTGYSSLSYLKRLPLDQLKIDQSFVRDILLDANDAAIAKMVIVLADSLGLAVIAEGVETQAQRKFLADMGCHACQGYLFGRPLPLDEVEKFLTPAR